MASPRPEPRRRLLELPADGGGRLSGRIVDVKVDNIFGIGALDTDGEGVVGVEGEGHQTPRRWGRVTALHSCVDLELQQPRVTGVEPARSHWV